MRCLGASSFCWLAGSAASSWRCLQLAMALVPRAPLPRATQGHPSQGAKAGGLDADKASADDSVPVLTPAQVKAQLAALEDRAKAADRAKAEGYWGGD